VDQNPWADVLRCARKRPAMYIGSEEAGHVWAVTWTMRLLWQTASFADVRRAAVRLSRKQYVLRGESGPVANGIEPLVDWEGCGVLFNELLRVGGDLLRRAGDMALAESAGRAADDALEWMRRYSDEHICFGNFGHPLYLADRGVLAIRASAGLWCQTYEHGWPRTPPFLVQSSAPVGLVVAASLNSEYFTGLPFRLEEVEVALPDEARPHVRLEYRPEDDLVPERLLEPANFAEWLQ
jgi:hypothetical protein